MVTCPPQQGDVSQLDDEVWALFSNFSNGHAGSSRFFPSSKSSTSSSSLSSSSSSFSSSSRWSLRNPSPPSRSGTSSSLKPTRPQAYSPLHSLHLQVHVVRDCKTCFGFLMIFLTCGVSLWVLGPAVDATEQELSEPDFSWRLWRQQHGRPLHVTGLVLDCKALKVN